MGIELINADGITLKTKDKYCSEDSEYENYLKNSDIVAETHKKWYGLKQEKLTDTKNFERWATIEEIPKELHALYKRKINNRMQVGKSKMFGNFRL